MVMSSTNSRSLLVAATITGVLAFTAAGTAMAGISTTKHNLGSGGASQYGATSSTDEICVFCHTPHGADNSTAVPLWNKDLPTPGTFTTYDTLNTSSLDATQRDVGSVSLACLSCHDGAQAMDTMINQPGSGGYNAAGASLDTLAAMSGTPIPNLGTDLTNDHPISIAYAGGGPVAGDGDGLFTGTLADADFKAPFKDTINSKPVWWVDESSGTSGTREKTDMQLYTRNDSGFNEPFVECASCHDPHSTNITFLRVPNSGSAVCLTCHTK